MVVTNLRTLDRPGAVQNLNATGVNTDSIEINWDPPADDGGSAILGYRIQASNDGGSSYSVLRSSSTGSEADTTSEYVHDGLEPDETWHYLVSAINSTGEGTITGTSATTKREGEVPGAPTELTAEPDGNTAIDLGLGRADGTPEPARSPATGSRSPPTAATSGPIWSPTPATPAPSTNTRGSNPTPNVTTRSTPSTTPARATPPMRPKRPPPPAPPPPTAPPT